MYLDNIGSKRSEEALRQSEERLRAIIETTPECVSVVAPDGTLLLMNSAGLSMIEADCSQMVLGRNLYDIVAPEDRDRFREFNERICRGEKGSLEFDLIGFHGSRRHMESHAAPLQQADGTTVHIAVARDITARKHAEQLLRQGEVEFRGLANAMPQLAWMANPDGEIFWYNDRWYDYTGATFGELEGWGWQSIHDPLLLPDVLERWKASLRTGEPFEMTFPLRGADGVFRPFLTRAEPIRDSKGKISRWFGTNTDIGAEVQIRQELQESQERLRSALVASQRFAAIVESSDDAIVSKDLNGIVTSWNPCAERIFGYTAEEMIGQPITRIIPPELHADEQRILATIARGERIDHFETIRRTKGGDLIEVSLTISPVKDDTGKIVGIAKIARDITQRKKAERSLHTAERLASVGRLAATIAHEINNPLEAVTNLIYLAKQNTHEPVTRRYLADAEEELARVSLLTKQTLGFYRETKAIGSLTLGDLVNPLISVFSSRARNKVVEIETEIKQNPIIYGVPGEIRQLFANLLGNSIDAVAAGGNIRIRVSAATERRGEGRAGVRLTVADSGTGIPPTIRKNLFEPFFTTKKEVGTGLGLWVCKGIVDKHGGYIRVRSSVAPGRSWTVFSVFLPIHSDVNAVESDLSRVV